MKGGLYALKYYLDFEQSDTGFSKEEIKLESRGKAKPGGTDALLVASIIRQGERAHDGAASIRILSIDGQNEGKGIPNTEIFSVWSMLAHDLSEDENLPNWQREIAKEAFLKVKNNIMNIRKNDAN